MKSSNSTFVCDLAASLNFDVAFACNVFVYCPEAEVIRLLSELGGRCRRDSKIVIMEPYPMWYWEFVFEGMRLHPRSPAQVSALLTQAGWTPTLRSRASLLKVFGKSVFPICYCMTAIRTANKS